MHHTVIDREAGKPKSVALFPQFRSVINQSINQLITFSFRVFVSCSLTFVVLPISFLLFWSSDDVSELRGRLSSLADLSQMMVFAAEPWH